MARGGGVVTATHARSQTTPQRAALGFTMAYAIILIYLFVQFFTTSYKVKPKSKAVAGKGKQL